MAGVVHVRTVTGMSSLFARTGPMRFMQSLLPRHFVAGVLSSTGRAGRMGLSVLVRLLLVIVGCVRVLHRVPYLSLSG